MPVVGQKELSARLVALGLTPEAIVNAWSKETVRLAKARVRVRTGATQRSIRIEARSAKGAKFVAGGAAQFLEKGTPPHPIPGGKNGGPLKGKALAFKDGGRTIFAKKVNHPRTRKHTFMRVSANAALRGLKREIAALWDKAA